MPFRFLLIATITSLLSLTSAKSSGQTILRVNNNPGVITNSVVYSDLQTAVNNAADGDVIVLEPSGQGYGDLFSFRSLVIYGPGYLLGQNPNPPADTRSGFISLVQLDASATGPIVFEGIHFTGEVNVRASNVTFRGCFFDGQVNLGDNSGLITQNLRFERCFFNYQASNFSIQTNSNYRADNVVITNCIISNAVSNTNGTVGQNTGWILEYNLFYSDGVNFSFENVQLRNNIFYSNVSSNTFLGTFNATNNVLTDAALPATNGNLINLNANDLFEAATVGFPPSLNLTNSPPTGYTYENQFKIVAGSVAETVGPGATLIGIYGGATPYKLGGKPTYPEIFQFNVAPAASATVPLTVTIGVRSNN